MAFGQKITEIKLLLKNWNRTSCTCFLGYVPYLATNVEGKYAAVLYIYIYTNKHTKEGTKTTGIRNCKLTAEMHYQYAASRKNIAVGR